MQRSERLGACRALGTAALLIGATTAAASSAPAPYRYQAPIVVDAPAPFVQIALPAAAYGRVEQDGLRDLRIVDARGERVPFAILPPRSTVYASEQVREASLYPLPAKPSASGDWPSPVDVVVEGDRISVRRHGGTLASAPASGASPGWLVDSGEHRADEPLPRSLRLRWSAPAEFSVAYSIETSDDLRQWRPGGSGQLMALQSPAGPLTQPVVVLPAAPARFVRLVWSDPAAAPVLTGASVLATGRRELAFDPARELTFAASAEPAGPAASDPAARRALHFDLGGVLPLIDVDLRFDSGTHVAPARLQGRARSDQPWGDLGSGVFYRLERGSDSAGSPPIALPVAVRFLRIVPDERASALDAAQARLVVHAALASIVFAAQGEPPFRLLAGSRDAPAGALPVSVVVPQLESERARFGHATLGEFQADAAAARAAEDEVRQARLRPWLLWAVLIAGVIGLGALVWRLARSGPAQPPTPPGPPA
ncbi:MAG TPA: DUF3999 family protein [Caldimonas sp.]|jgi:hypothetical protein